MLHAKLTVTRTCIGRFLVVERKLLAKDSCDKAPLQAPEASIKTD